MRCKTTGNQNESMACKPKGECPCAPGSKKSIEDVVVCFSSDMRGLTKEKEYYSSLSPSQAVNNAGLALSIWYTDQETARKHPHQFRRQNAALESTRVALLAKEKELLSCTVFDELHDLVNETISEIDGIGALMVYDTALRIGMNTNVTPEKVYLHAGTLRGASAVVPVGRKRVLNISELPKEFHALDADSIESCLCVCKEQLKLLGIHQGGSL